METEKIGTVFFWDGREKNQAASFKMKGT